MCCDERGWSLTALAANQRIRGKGLAVLELDVVSLLESTMLVRSMKHCSYKKIIMINIQLWKCRKCFSVDWSHGVRVVRE